MKPAIPVHSIFHSVKSPDEMLRESDELMYQDKARIKKELEQQGIIRKRTKKQSKENRYENQ